MDLKLINILLIISSAFSLGLFVYTLSRRRSLLNVSFGLFALSSAFYAFGYCFELLSSDLESMLFWSRIQYIGIPFQSGLFITFTLSYIGKEKFLTPLKLGFIFLIPVVSFAARWTNSFHNLFYCNISVFDSSIGPLLEFDPGPFYYLHISYLIIVLAASSILMIRFIARTSTIYRNQAKLIIGALLIQWSALLLYLTGLSPDYLDINPVMFSISALLYGFGIYRFSMFNLVPVARATVFDEMNDAVLVVDPDLRLVDFNKRCFTLFDEVSHKNIGRRIEELFIAYPAVPGVFGSKDDAAESVLVYKELSEPLHFKLSVNHLSGRKNRKIGSILTFNDISDQIRHMAELEELAAVDSLTGIFNRRQLLILSEIELKRAGRSSNELSLILLDLDHFKVINDTYGHDCGDNALKAFCTMVSGNIRGSDIFGRYGGEEFIIVMPDTGRDTALEISERLRSRTEALLLEYRQQVIKITVSIGLSGNWANDADSLEKLVQNADNALYSAKRNGRNQVMFN